MMSLVINQGVIGLLLALLLSLPVGQTHASANGPATNRDAAKNYRLNTLAVIRRRPEGRIVDIWEPQTPFTSAESDGDWIRITGTFPEGRWQPVEGELWVTRFYTSLFTPKYTQPPPPARPKGIERYVRIDKSAFTLEVIERQEGQEKVLVSTQVALGMDGCLPEEKGGRCYYTEPGDYAVRWKVYDPEGIEWCIPSSMEKEYQGAIDRGQRCYRGPLGKFALNIGKSYAIHGTNKPESLGKRVSHGCVRAENRVMEELYQMMEVGDRIIIAD